MTPGRPQSVIRKWCRKKLQLEGSAETANLSHKEGRDWGEASEVLSHGTKLKEHQKISVISMHDI